MSDFVDSPREALFFSEELMEDLMSRSLWGGGTGEGERRETVVGM